MAETSPTPIHLHVAPSPHLSDATISTRRMMLDVVLGLIPVMLVAVFVFRGYAVQQVLTCVVACLAAEAVFTKMRGQALTLGDFSALITGIILGLSLPWSAPWYVGVIGSFIAIGLGKTVFGGLGYNIFNPAMVGRAFVMLSFAKALGASAYMDAEASLRIVTEATPLTAAKTSAELAGALEFWPLFLGTVNGSLGETSSLAVLIGGIYLLLRRSASWEIPAAALVAAFLLGGLCNLMGLSPVTAWQHLLSGALMFGAFFIATDPVSSPVTPRGKLIFGAGFGLWVILLRVFSSYPAGTMFAILLMNAATPLINRWTVPTPVGGTPKPKS